MLGVKYVKQHKELQDGAWDGPGSVWFSNID